MYRKTNLTHSDLEMSDESDEWQVPGSDKENENSDSGAQLT